ncbi:hypothetical protein HUT18_13385 [Streptomyces sp. NA04227]|uniref:DUF5954 family protein n=1 Tax=Streptomyces sp. NA04227 TaxID=2742136 RepID=UPI0015916BBA|nr:DUF5954 family protein [Streptomyces sp. NA04227]QKW07237.1 hypothetical protein HUT18_13385 [Streptomyces sp. NA04227]
MVDDWKRELDQLHAGLVSRDDPAEMVAEADAMDASVRYPQLAVRGPVFGVAVQDPRTDEPWRVVESLSGGAPQEARDGLNSLLWFRAKDDTDDPGVRRELLAAVAKLESEPVDEVEALGLRYRVVRGDQVSRIGEDGLEPPRPTDREPADRSWEHRSGTTACDEDFLLDPDGSGGGLAAGALRLGLRGFAYAGARFPADVREDSERAVRTHPGIVLLPVAFGVVERSEKGWAPRGAFMATPHDARRLLYSGMTEIWPMFYDFDDAQRAAYTRAAEEFKAAERANEVRVDGSLFRICRIERLVRVGPDGPETPRPSDQDSYGPMKMHPTMDEDGTIHYDE